jgi:ABC-type multidrug transport system ATPase subunit/ABC-type transporter Mla maintaining outer membrane lipid asymmetry permease subunit MlaE
VWRANCDWQSNDRKNLMGVTTTALAQEGQQERTSCAQSPATNLIVENLTIQRPDGCILLQNTTLDLAPGELVLLVGPSGSGKSTLMLLLAGLLDRTTRFAVHGRMICAGKSCDLADYGTARPRNIGGMVFQDHALFDDLNARENLHIAMDHAKSAVTALGNKVGALLAGISASQAVSSCSGGQRQRLAIARTVLADQPVLLFDEPNSGLDIAASRELIGLVRDICNESGKPALVTVHHFQDLLPLADRVLLLDPHRQALVPMPSVPEMIEAGLKAAANPLHAPSADRGNGVNSDWQLGRGRLGAGFWFLRYLASYTWMLCATPAMLLYLAGGASIFGFVTIWFGFNYYSFGGYLKSLLHDDTLIGLGMVQARIAIPLLASILFVSRNSAVIATDVGNRVLSSQFQAMRNLGIPGSAYVFGAILMSMTLGCTVFVLVSLLLGAWAAQETWHFLFPTQYRALFQAQFFHNVLKADGWPLPVMIWVPIKAASSGLLAGIASLIIAASPKASNRAVGHAVANAIVLGVLLTLLVHAIVTIMIL